MNFTWQNLLAVVVCMAGPIVAYKFVGPEAAAGANVVALTVMGWLNLRKSDGGAS